MHFSASYCLKNLASDQVLLEFQKYNVTGLLNENKNYLFKLRIIDNHIKLSSI